MHNYSMTFFLLGGFSEIGSQMEAEATSLQDGLTACDKALPLSNITGQLQPIDNIRI